MVMTTFVNARDGTVIHDTASGLIVENGHTLAR